MRMIGRLNEHNQAWWPHWMTLRRFIGMSEEEVDARRLAEIDLSAVPHQIDGLEHLTDASRKGTGVVLLTAHFDSLYVGLALLARVGVRVNLMSTSLTSDPRVPRAISRHFALKKATLSRLLRPGKVVDVEGNMSFFVRALKRGEVVVIACDGPTTSAERSQAVSFLGQRWLMASGPQFLAQATNSPTALYTCIKQPRGRFRIEISPPVMPAAGGLQRAYSRLEHHIRAAPWRWWAADLYPAYVAASPLGDHDRAQGEGADDLARRSPCSHV